MDGIFVLSFFLILLLVLGGICGFLSLSKVQKLTRRLRELENQMKSLRPGLQRKQEHPPSQPVANVAGEEHGDKEPLRPVPETPTQPAPISIPKFSPQPQKEKTVPAPAGRQALALEVKLGTRWLNWVGIVMTVVGIGFFLKYAYDNAWIGPSGRLAIGTFLGIAALALGERFRRKDWGVLFQVLTGGGIAAFYLCVFFSFQVYHLSDQTFSMILTILVTALAVAMAVAHDAAPIAILGLLGGFLSPVLLSTGTNHPYALFIYIAILNLVALGAAYFRRWRALDFLCFLGTSFIYQGWYRKFYASDQMMPALIFISLFYLMFLLIPTLHSLVRRVPETVEGLAMVALNAAFSFFCYYDVLFRDYRYALGFVTLGQALLVLLLFQAWVSRIGNDTWTPANFLIIALGLVTIAVPIQLKLYGIPIAWSMEGAVFVFLGIRFRQIICRAAGVVALILAGGGLLIRLPLHSQFFTPVLNIPFGSWAVVTAMAGVSGMLISRDKENRDLWHQALKATASLLAFALGCLLLSLEVSHLWATNYPIANFRTYENASLMVLWSAIPAITALFLKRAGLNGWMPVSWVCLGVGALVMFAGLWHYDLPSPWLLVNAACEPKLVFVVCLWWCARISREGKFGLAADIQALAGHGVLALLLFFELDRWGQYSHLITPKMSVSLISAAWATQAFAAIWVGLVTRNRLLRYLGFGLFFLTVGKTLLLDMSELEKVYRIVSFAASGFLLLAAGYFYQRYSGRLLERPQEQARR